MKGKQWLILMVSLGVFLLASNIGVTRSSFADPESSTGNAFQAWASSQWVQTTRPDFEAGVLNNVDTSSSPGDVKLAISSNWYNASWAYRKKITINHTKVSANLTDFPVLVGLASDADLASDAQDDGDDILFTSSNGTSKLSHEIERFNGGTGELVAWVKVPTLSSSTDTDIYMYYGNSLASNQQNTAGVWDSNYRAVWHLKETTGGTNAIKDSTSNANHGTDGGNPTLGATGKIGNCVRFDGTDDHIAVPSSASLKLGSGLTIEAWIRINVWGDWADIVFKGGGSENNSDYQFALVTTGLAWDGTYAGTWRTKYFNTTQNTGTWIYVALTHDTVTVRCYRGGSEISSQSDPGAIYQSDYQLGISREGAASYGWLNGRIDEVRISNIARSAGWIATGYNNMNSPSTFYSVGVEQGSSSLGTIASQVLNTGVAGARWDALFWDETLESGTDITFKVRASDTPFLKDAATPSWVPVGGTSPVTSGLPSGQYMQWQASLTTSDTSKTPVLHEVRVYHSDY